MRRKFLHRHFRKNQLDFLKEIQEDAAMQPGSLDLAKSVSQCFSEMIRGSKTTRWEIAGEMSMMAAREITKRMIDNYTSPEGSDYNLPAYLIPAATFACRDFSLIELLAKASGGNFLNGEENILAEIARRENHIQELEEEKEQLHTLLSRIKGSGKKI